MSSVIPLAISAERAVPDRWTAADVARIDPLAMSTAPLIGEREIVRVSAELDIWDAWPLQTQAGAPMVFEDGATLWMALAAPRF